MTEKKKRFNILYLFLALSLAFAVAASLIFLSLMTDPGERHVSESVPISFSWWGNDPRHEYTMKGIELFEQENPSVSVSESYGVWNGYEYKNRIAMMSDMEADVMQINYSWLREYSPDGEGYYDLNLLKDQIDMTQFSEEDLERGSVSGKLNALPIAYNMPVFLYNQDILERYGLKVPSAWDDLFAAAEAMSKDGVYTLNVVTKHLWLMLLARYEQVNGKDAFDQDGHCLIDEAGFRDMLTFYKKLYDRKVIPTVGTDGNVFSNGRAAGALAWISDADRYSQVLVDKKVSVIVGPSLTLDGTGYAGWHMKPASLLAVSRITDHPDQAGQLVDFLLNDPDFALLQGTEKGVPVSRKAYEALSKANAMNPLQEQATETMMQHQEEITLLSPRAESTDLITVFKEESDKYLFGKAPLGECARNIVLAIQNQEDAGL